MYFLHSFLFARTLSIVIIHSCASQSSSLPRTSTTGQRRTDSSTCCFYRRTYNANATIYQKRQKRNQWSGGSNGRKIETLVTLPHISSFFKSRTKEHTSYVAPEKKKPGRGHRRHTLLHATASTRIHAGRRRDIPHPAYDSRCHRQDRLTLHTQPRTLAGQCVPRRKASTESGVQRSKNEARSLRRGRVASVRRLQGLTAETGHGRPAKCSPR